MTHTTLTGKCMATASNVGAPLPFFGLEELTFCHVISGPRISMSQTVRVSSITIRNYLAGHTKKYLRLRGTHVSDLRTFNADLPVELQLLVLEHLHPIDLYHFSLVSKYFRRLVLHPAALTVWKAAFMRHPDLPTPPPGVKEPDWTFMIYGPGICGECGKYGALTDFSLLKRFCGPCLNAHTLLQRDFRDESKRSISFRHVIWTLIPYTDRCNGIRHTMDSARFLKTDFSTMWKKLQLLGILHKNGLRLLSPLLTDYISACKDYIKKLQNSAAKSNRWAQQIFRQLVFENNDLTYRLTAKITLRLQVLGFSKQDVDSIFHSIRRLLQQKAIYRLTRRVFREIRPRLEALLRKRRIERTRDERRKLLLGVYRDYVKARSPDEWSYLPDVNTPSILETGIFKKLLGRPTDESVDITPASVVPFLPEFIEEWIKARREKFADVLPTDPDETLEARVQRLELATSVVTCKTCCDCRPLVGWKSICRHQLNSGEECRRYVFTGRPFAAATALVSCIGLDPLTTTADDMNRRNDRFMCGNCSPGLHHGRVCRQVYTWLECLQHGMSYDGFNSTSHVEPVWLPLSPPAARFVRGHEKPYPEPSNSVWRCNHCAHHFEKQVSQADAVDHVKMVHCIRTPAIGVDVVADPRQPIHKRREAFRLLDPPYDHICKHCSDMPIFKLWEKGVLMHHLIRKHHIPEPAEHVDWEAVPIILSAAPVPP